MKAATPIRNSGDLDALRRRLRPLVGEACWRARLAYGDELKLDFGERIPHKHPKLKGLIYGSWILGSQGTTWRLESGDRSVSSRSRRPRVQEALRELSGGTVEAVTIGYRQLGLGIRFNNGFTLRIQHEAGRPTYDVPYWELFTPRGACIQVGPGRRWSIAG